MKAVFILGVGILLAGEARAFASPCQEERPPQASPKARRLSETEVTGLKFMGAGVAAGLVGVGVEVSVHLLPAPSSGFEVMKFNERAHDRQVAALVLFGVGGVALLAGATLALWPSSHEVSVAISPNGLITLNGRM